MTRACWFAGGMMLTTLSLFVGCGGEETKKDTATPVTDPAAAAQTNSTEPETPVAPADPVLDAPAPESKNETNPTKDDSGLPDLAAPEIKPQLGGDGDK